MNDPVDPTSSPPHFPGSPGPGYASRDPAELADLYAVGALSRAEAAEFEARVKAGDGAYVRELARVRPVMEQLLGSFEAVEAPAEVRERVERRIGEQVKPGSLREKWETEDEEARARAGGREKVVQYAQSSGSERSDERTATGITVLRGYLTGGGDGGGKWLPTGARGVKFRPLYADWRANRRTILLKMEPGSELPDHDHAGVEEVVMIQGDLTIGGTTLHAGDYIRNEPGADHGVPRTESGCVCIVISAYQPFPAVSWLGMAWTVVKGLFGVKSKG